MARSDRAWIKSTRRHAEEEKRVKIEAVGKALDRPEGQVPLAPLQAAHVGAVNPQDRGEGLLAQAVLLAVGAQHRADDLLKLALHGRQRTELLLFSLHTYE